MSNLKENTDIFNIKEFLLQIVSNKYLYLVSLILFIAVAYLYNRMSPLVYQVNSVIGPVEDDRSSLLSSGDMFAGFGNLSGQNNLEDDVNSLSSFGLVSETINQMNLEVGYFQHNNSILGQPRQLYNSSPVKVIIDKSHPQPINMHFNIEILDEKSFRLSAMSENVRLYNYLDNEIISSVSSLFIDDVYQFNETIEDANFKFTVSLNSENPSTNLNTGNSYYFEFYHLDYLAKNYLQRLNVTPVSTRSSQIEVFFQGENRTLTIDFLNNYLKTYLDNNLAKKNKIAFNTVNFIDSQISEISDSLVQSESKLSAYRSANQVTDLSYQGQQALEQMTQIENELSTLQVQKRYYNYVLDYLNKNQDLTGLAPPSVANVTDPIMNTMVLELLDLNTQKSTILSNNSEKNLFLGQIENRIRLQKQAIIENVTNSLNTLEMTENELNYREEKLSRAISRLPRTELNMVSMQRKFNLTDAIYTFLLQKRSEAAITMASNYPDYEILEPARYISSFVVSPKKMLNYLVAIFAAILIPSIFLILKSFFNEKITSVREAEFILKRPVLGNIFSNHYGSETIVPDKPESDIAESFRNLRANLFLKLNKKQQNLIMITSSQPEDGKSFISFNLAASIASVGYKTLVLDADMRRPSLHKKFKIENRMGLSNFIANHTTPDDIILKSTIENLFFIPTGPFIPNFTEKIQGGSLDRLFSELKEKYEIIILDTTPAGLVADATLLTKYSDQVLLVCRNNHTRKDVFAETLDLFHKNNVENLEVVINDLNLQKSKYGRYNAYYKKVTNRQTAKTQKTT